MFNQYNWAQRKAQESLAAVLQAGVQRTYVDMPTGTGKTGVMLGLLDLMDSVGGLPSTVIMAPTRLIADNIFAEINKFAPGLRQSNKAARLQVSDLGDDSARRVPIKVMTYQSGARALEHGIITPRLIMPDEGHHALSIKRHDILSALPYDNTQIAFTASPAYAYDKSLPDAGYKLAYKLGLQEAVEGNILSSIRNVLIQMEYADLDLDNIDLKSNGDYDATQLERIVNDSRVLEAMFHFYTEGINPVTGRRILGSNAIANCNSIDHAMNCADYFNRRFKSIGGVPKGIIPAAAIWGDMPKNKKDDLIEAHRAGQIWILSNANYLIEGYDNIKTSIALNAKPTRSGVVAEQRGGRPIRFNPDEPDKVAVVADFVFPGKRKQQLLYGDVIGGFLFNRSDLKADYNHSGERYSDHPVLDGIKISYTEESIFSYLGSRNFSRASIGSLPSVVPFPAAAIALERKRIYTRDAFMNAAHVFLIKHELQDDPSYKKGAKEGTLLRTLRGEQQPFLRANKNTVFAAYSHAARIVAGVLELPASKIFGSIPKNAKPLKELFAEEGIPQNISLDDEENEEFADGWDAVERDIALSSHDPYPDPDAGLTEEKLKLVFNAQFAKILAKTERVLRHRFGIGVKEKSLEEIGQELGGVTRENIRQREAKGLRKLGLPWMSKELATVFFGAPDKRPSRFTGDWPLNPNDMQDVCNALTIIPDFHLRYMRESAEVKEKHPSFKEYFLNNLRERNKSGYERRHIESTSSSAMRYLEKLKCYNPIDMDESIKRARRMMLYGTNHTYVQGKVVFMPRSERVFKP